MKYIFGLVIIFLLLSNSVGAQSIEIGQKFPLEKLTNDSISADSTIVAFVPTLSEDCVYASMLTQSFYYYFDRKLAFADPAKSPTMNVVFVVRDKVNAPKSTQNIMGGMKVVYDEKGTFFSEFGVPQPSGANADSTVVLLDRNKTIAFIDKSYRAQGEHLKPLERKLKDLNGVAQTVADVSRFKRLRIGDIAPDFAVNETERLSSYRGQVVLISFYPAAFSGTLPKSNSAFDALSTKTDMMSCAYQIEILDAKSGLFGPKESAKKILISSSTKALLWNWQSTLKTEHIIYANDEDYSTSLKYGSYNPKGYNERVTVIVDRRGRIAYYDKSFDERDAKVVNAKLNSLLLKVVRRNAVGR